MKPRNLVFAFMTCASLIAYGQEEISKSVHANYILPRIGKITSGDMIIGLPPNEKSEVVGDVYWDTHWNLSTVSMYKSEAPIEGHLLRYDVYKDEFEFSINKQVKVLYGTLVKNVVWLDTLTQKPHYLANAKEYIEDGTPSKGFVEVLVDGNTLLLKKVYLEILKPDFNPALNVGRKEARIIKKNAYYYNSKTELFKIKSLKNIRPLFKGKTTEIDEFIKRENIKVSKESDLIKLFTYLNDHPK